MPPISEKEGLKIFGQNVRKFRKAKKLTMQALANMAEIELSQVSRIETAKHGASVRTVFKLANALEIHPQDLFEM